MKMRFVLPVALAAAAGLLAPGAQARGFVGFSIAGPIGPPPVVYGPPPVYYGYPPPVVYAPPPGYVAPPASFPPPGQTSGQGCREYQSGAMIGGQMQQTVGLACLQPDGSWRIVR